MANMDDVHFTLKGIEESLKGIHAQSAQFRQEDADARAKQQKDLEKEKAETKEAEKPLKLQTSLKNLRDAEFQIGEKSDDRFRTISQFGGTLAQSLSGGNSHTKSAMKIVFFLASSVGIIGQLGRQNASLISVQENYDLALKSHEKEFGKKEAAPSPGIFGSTS